MPCPTCFYRKPSRLNFKATPQRESLPKSPGHACRSLPIRMDSWGVIATFDDVEWKRPDWGRGTPKATDPLARRGSPRSARVSDPAEIADRRSPAIGETFGRPSGSVRDRPHRYGEIISCGLRTDVPPQGPPAADATGNSWVLPVRLLDQSYSQIPAFPVRKPRNEPVDHQSRVNEAGNHLVEVLW